MCSGAVVCMMCCDVGRTEDRTRLHHQIYISYSESTVDRPIPPTRLPPHSSPVPIGMVRRDVTIYNKF
jgi:hypothetical protein